MRVRFIKSSANPAGAYPVGRVETFPDHVGQQLVDSGVAEPVVSEHETAAIEPELPDERAPAPKRRRPTKRG